jgi:hypothetical protein
MSYRYVASIAAVVLTIAWLGTSGLQASEQKKSGTTVGPHFGTVVDPAGQPTVKVQGKVVDRETKTGIGGVRVTLYQRAGIGVTGTPKTAVADGQGGFTVQVKPGRFSVNLSQIPDQYLSPSYRRGGGSTPQRLDFEITGQTTLPPIELERAASLQGVVVDEAGKPAAGAEVRYLDPDSFSSSREALKCDAEGKFAIKGLVSQGRLMIKARTEKAVTEPMAISLAQKEPVRLMLSAKKAFALRGAVVDEEGRPVSRARLSGQMTWSIGSTGHVFPLAEHQADAQGRFEIGGLWAGDAYRLRAESDGFAPDETPSVQGVAGQVREFPKIVLRSHSGTIEGTVVDSAGKPLAGVQVFNSGDGPQVQTTQSDTAGRFHLAGLFRGPVYAFAEKEGFRFTGVRVVSGAKEVTIRMLRSDEAPPALPNEAHPIAWEQQKQVARELLGKLWEKDARYRTYDAVLAMARVDPATARQWSAESGGKYDRPVRRALAPQIAQSDIEEAMSLIAEEGPRAQYLYQEVAQHLASVDRAKALRLAEEAVVRARAEDQPRRAGALAEGGELLVRLGSIEAGRKILEEAAEMASKMGHTGNLADLRGRIAVAVASCDVPQALSLVEGEGLDPHRRDSYRAKIAACLDDVSKAEAILKDMDPVYIERGRLRLAYRLAPTRLEEAVRLIETPLSLPLGYRDESASKALAYGWLAVAVAPRDKMAAWALVDKAFSIYRAPSSQRPYVGNYGGHLGQSAHLAAQAKDFGYPDLQRLVWQVLALRPTLEEATNSSARLVETRVVMALFLAKVDRQTAEQILWDIEPQSDLIGSGSIGVGRREWLRAWALTNPVHAIELAEREAASTAKTDAAGSHFWLLDLADLWSLDPAEQLKKVASGFDLQSPEEDNW